MAAGQPLALTLQLDPAQGPLTYAWSDHGATTPGATYLWQTPGKYTVTASATNWCRTVTASLEVTVTAEPVRIWLPIISRGSGVMLREGRVDTGTVPGSAPRRVAGGLGVRLSLVMLSFQARC